MVSRYQRITSRPRKTSGFARLSGAGSAVRGRSLRSARPQRRAGERLGLGPAHAGLEARVVEQADHQAVVRGEIDCAAGVVEHRVGLGLEVVHEAEGLRRLLHQAALDGARSEEHTSELQSLMRISYA